MKILVAVDGSIGALAAVESVGQLASASDAVALYYSPPRLRSMAGSESELIDRVLNEAASRLPDAWQAGVERIIDTHPPRTGILSTAEQWEADMIALGARGLGPIRSLVLGSVSRSVVHGSKFPTLIARPAQPREKFRVLLATDDSPAARQAVEFLSQLTLPKESEGNLIWVLESLFGGELPAWLAARIAASADNPTAQAFEQERQQMRQETLEKLQTIQSTLPPAFAAALPIVVEGHPAEQILRAIEQTKTDLVVVGARGLGRFSRLLGSTSEKLLDAAPCSVLVVPLQGTA